MTQAEQAFDDSKPLFMGMGNDEALLAVTQIASEFGMLSDRCRNTLDVYRAIADKLPAELSGKREAIEDKINEWRYTNWSPWRSFDAYSGYIASLVSSGRAETNAADANAAAAARAAAAAAAADAARAAEAAAAAARARDERAPPRETKCNKCAAALQAGKIDRRLAEKVCPGGLRRGTCVVCRSGPVPAKVDGPGDKPLGRAARKVLIIANKQYNGEEDVSKGEANAAEATATDLRAAVPDDAVFGDAGCIGALETASAEATPAGDSAANAHDDGLEAYTSQLAALRGDIAHTTAPRPPTPPTPPTPLPAPPSLQRRTRKPPPSLPRPRRMAPLKASPQPTASSASSMPSPPSRPLPSPSSAPSSAGSTSVRSHTPPAPRSYSCSPSPPVEPRSRAPPSPSSMLLHSPPQQAVLASAALTSTL